MTSCSRISLSGRRATSTSFQFLTTKPIPGSTQTTSTPTRGSLPTIPTPDYTQPPSPPIRWLEIKAAKKRTSFEVIFHPDGLLVVGDLVSLEVLPPDGFDPEGRKVSVSLAEAPGAILGEAAFTPVGLGGRIQATLQWIWNTSSLSAGDHILTFKLEPDGLSWNETVSLLPRGQLPAAEQTARWAQAESECCLVHYITGTSAARDLPVLLQIFDDQAQDASQRLGVSLPEPVEVTLLPRVIGHGGFADGGIAISYLDRNYAGGDTAIIFHHELIHLLDARLGGEIRPSFLVEGLAVYESGGHFKPEPQMPRAAALLPPSPGCTAISLHTQPDSFVGIGQVFVPSSLSSTIQPDAKPCGLGLYIPLARLFEGFYTQQHEIGYLEASSLIEYMVGVWGWKAFSAFYRDIHPQEKASVHASLQVESDSVKAAVEDALQRHFGLSLPQLEKQFLQALGEVPLSSRWVEDVRLDLTFHDRVRAYQQQYDPPVYFLSAWLPDSQQMRHRGIIADYLRSPSRPENYALETLLAAADAELRQSIYPRTDDLLEAITSVLSSEQVEGAQVFQHDPLAADYFSLVTSVLASGGEPQRIVVTSNLAQVWASRAGVGLGLETFLKIKGNWLPLEASAFGWADKRRNIPSVQ